MTVSEVRDSRPAIPISWQQLASAKLLMKPIGRTEPERLRVAAAFVGVTSADLDLALWRTLGGGL